MSSRFFDGNDDEIDCGDSTVLQIAGSRTLTAWFKHPSGSGNDYVVTKGVATTANFYIIVQSGGKILMGYRQADGGGWNEILSTNTFNDDKWRFVVAIKGASDFLYVDGFQEGTRTGDEDAVTNTEVVRIGRTNGGDFYIGNIAHVHIYNRSLNLFEANQIRLLPASLTNGLVGYWALQGVPVEPDLSGNDNNGTVTGAIFDKASPPINSQFVIPTPAMMGAS